MAKRKKVSKLHYVDNAKFLEAMTEYKRDYNLALKNNKELPPVSEYLGSVFLKIAQRLSFRPNFINYTFKNDMISDGIENCLHYIHNFNPEKSNNPFAYFTQIIYYAFIRRIQKEKKQLYVKYKTMDSFSTLGENTEISEHDGETQYVFDTMNTDQKANMYDFISNFEEAKKKKSVSKKKTPTNLEYFMVA